MSATRPPIRHGRLRKQRGVLGPIARVVAVVVAVAMVSSAGVAAIAASRLAGDVAANSIVLDPGTAKTTVPPAQALSGAFNVLLVGADNSSDQKGFGAARQATMNDVDILVHVDADHRSAVVLSFPRDLIIDHPVCTDPATGTTAPATYGEALNTDLSRGGLPCVVDTVHALTGLDISYAALFTFQGTVEMADAVGGVPVCVTHAVDDPSSGLKLKAGVSIVSGRTALAYLRDRHGVGDGSDLARISSQQAYMSSLLRVVASSGTWANPVRLYSLADAVVHDVSLSTSLADPTTLVGMMVAVKQIPLSSMSFIEYPWQLDPANTDKVIPQQALAAVVLAKIKADEPVRLAKGTTGYATVVEQSKKAKATDSPIASPTPSATKSSADDAISGLNGQTANEVTCSVSARE